MKMAQETNNWQLECAEMKQRAEFLFRTKLWSDVVFQFGRKKFIRAHKLILAMASPVFGSMFYDHVFVNPVRITDVPAEVFNVFLEYIYSDNMRIPSPDYACDLYYAGRQYDMPYVTQQCVQYLSRHINQDNICHIYEVAWLSREEALQEACLEIFRRQTKEVLSSDRFTHAAQQTVVKLFSLDNVNIDSELDLYVAAVKYAEANDARDDSMLEYTKEMSMMSDGPSPSKRARLRFSDDFNTSKCCTEESGNILSKNSNESIRDDETKSRYSDILQQIRFLTLTPAEFAECRLLPSLLTSDQILALSLNIASKDTPVNMPEGFSYNMVPRNRSTQIDRQRITATFHAKIHNVMTLKKHESIPFYVRNTAWTFLMINDLRSSHDHDSFGIAVTCYLDNASANWLNTVKVKVKFYATDNSHIKVALNRQMNACKQSRFHGIWTTRLSRFQILHPTQPYVDGNTLTYKVYVTTEETSDEASTPNVPKDIRAGQDSNNNDPISQVRSQAPSVVDQSLNPTLKSTSVNVPSASQTNISSSKTLPSTPAVLALSKPESCGLRSPAPINMSSRNAKPVSHGMSDLSNTTNNMTKPAQLPQAIRLPPPVPLTPNQSQVKDNLKKYEQQLLQATRFSAPTTSGIPESRSNLTQLSQPSDNLNKLKLLLHSKKWSAVQHQFIYGRLRTAQQMEARGEITRSILQQFTYNTIRRAQIMQAGALPLPVYGDPGVRSITPFSRPAIAPKAATAAPLNTTFGLRPRHIRHTGPLPTTFGLGPRHTAASLAAVSHGKKLANLKSGEERITSSAKVLNMTDRPAVVNSGTPQTFVARPGVTHVSSVINKHYSATAALTSNVQMATDRVTAPSSGVTSVVSSNKTSEIPLPSISQGKEITPLPKDIKSVMSSSGYSDNVSSTVRETPKTVIATAKTQDLKPSTPMLNCSESSSDRSDADTSNLDNLLSIGQGTQKTVIATAKTQDSKPSMSMLNLSESSSGTDPDTSNLDNVPSTVRDAPKSVIATAKTQDSKPSMPMLNLSESSSGTDPDTSNLDNVPSTVRETTKTVIATAKTQDSKLSMPLLNLSESSSGTDPDTSNLDNVPSTVRETTKTVIATTKTQDSKLSMPLLNLSESSSDGSGADALDLENVPSIVRETPKTVIDTAKIQDCKESLSALNLSESSSDSDASDLDNLPFIGQGTPKTATATANTHDLKHSAPKLNLSQSSSDSDASDLDNLPSIGQATPKPAIATASKQCAKQSDSTVTLSAVSQPSVSSSSISDNSGSHNMPSTVLEASKKSILSDSTDSGPDKVSSTVEEVSQQSALSDSDNMPSNVQEPSKTGTHASARIEPPQIVFGNLPPNISHLKEVTPLSKELKAATRSTNDSDDSSTIQETPNAVTATARSFSTDSEIPQAASTPNKTIVTPTKISEFAKKKSVSSDTFHDKTDSLISGGVVPFSSAKDDVKGNVAVDLETYPSPNQPIRDTHSGATENTLPFSLSNITLDVETASFSLDILSSSEDSSDSECTSPPSKKVKRDMFESASANSTSALSFSLSNISPNGPTASCSIDILDSNEDSVHSPPPSKKIKRELIEYYKNESVSEDEGAYSFPKDIGIDAIKRESDTAESKYTATNPKYTLCSTVYSPSSHGNASTSSLYSSTSLRHAPMSPRSPTSSLYSPVHSPTTSVYSPLSPCIYAPTSSVYSPTSPSFASPSPVNTPTSLICALKSPVIPKSSTHSPKSYLSTIPTSTAHALTENQSLVASGDEAKTSSYYSLSIDNTNQINLLPTSLKMLSLEVVNNEALKSRIQMNET